MTFKYRYRKQIIGVLIFLILIGGSTSFLYFKSYKDTTTSTKVIKEVKKKPNKLEKTIKKEENENKEIMVDVKGEVANPNIYTLKSDSRVIDAINMAGGVTYNGDTSILNLSKKLEDEMVIIVYSYYEVKNMSTTKELEKTINSNCIDYKEEVKNDACIESDDDNKTGKVSINNGSVEDFMTLSGIGESKAKSIIKYREENGEFKSIEDIKNVQGIGDALFEKIKENITL